MFDFESKFEEAGGKVIEGVSIEGAFYQMICVHTTGLYVVLPEYDFMDDGRADVNKRNKEIDDMLYKLQKTLSISRGKILLFICRGDCWYMLNPISEEIEEVHSIEDMLGSCLGSGRYSIDENRANYFVQKLSFGGGKNDNGVVMESEGELYINRGGRWFPASADDPDEAFKNTCLFGVFGWGPINRGKKMTALLYIMTCGLFGIGWLSDVLAFLLGSAVDSEGRYYQPLSDKGRGWLMLLGCVAAFIPLLFLYVKLLAFLSNCFSNAVNGITGSKIGFTHSEIIDRIEK